MSVAPVSEYILGIDVLWDLALQMTVRQFRLQQRCISVREVQAILRGHVKHEPICLLKPRQVTNVICKPSVGSRVGKMKYQERCRN